MGTRHDLIKREVDLFTHILQQDNFSPAQTAGRFREGCPCCGSPSLGVYKKKNQEEKNWHCFSCGRQGDIFDWEIVRGRAASQKEAFRLIFELYPQYDQDPSHQSKTTTRMGKATWIYSQGQDLTQQQAETWIKTRKFGSLEQAAVKLLCGNCIRHDNYKGIESLLVPLFAPCDVFSTVITPEQIIGVQKISLTGEPFFSSDGKAVRKFFPRKTCSKGVYPVIPDPVVNSPQGHLKENFPEGQSNLQENSPGGQVIIVESVANALALGAIGYAAICIFSISNSDLVKEIKAIAAPEISILLWFDRGVEDKQEKTCTENGIRGIWFEEKEKNGFDVNDLLTQDPGQFPNRAQALLAGASQKCPYQVPVREKDASRKGETEKKSTAPWIDEKGRIVPGLAANHFFEKENGNLLYYAEMFWRYAAGRWVIVPDNLIRAGIQEMVAFVDRSLIRKNTVEDIIYQVRLLALAPAGFRFNPYPHLLNLQNGFYDVEKNIFIEHSHESRGKYSNIQLPFGYEPLANCNKWAQFIHSLNFSNESVHRLQEWVGYCLYPRVKIQKALYFKGEGDNGKSVFLNTVARLLGDACSRIEITEVFERFNIAELACKLANISADINAAKIFSHRFKELVDGNPQKAEKKHKDPFQFAPVAKYLFSANDYIPTKDRSHGFYKRFDMFEFTRIFNRDEQDPDLEDKLAQELPGIFLWAMNGLRGLREQGWKLTASKEVEKAKEEFQLATNPLQQFLSENCRVNTDQSIDCEIFRCRYVDWCLKNGYEALSENKLGRELKRLGILKVRTQQNSSRFYSYRGVVVTP